MHHEHHERKHRYVSRASYHFPIQPLYGNHRSDHDEVWHVYQLGRFDRYWPNNRKRNLHGGGLPNYPTDEGAVQERRLGGIRLPGPRHVRQRCEPPKPPIDRSRSARSRGPIGRAPASLCTNVVEEEFCEVELSRTSPRRSSAKLGP